MLIRQLRTSWWAAALISLTMARGQQVRLNLIRAIVPGVYAEQHDYTAAEYRQYQEAVSEKDAGRRIALLDAFVAKYPKSTLMPQILDLYYPAYMELKNYRKAFDYADQMLMLGAPLGTENRMHALYVRCKTFQNIFDPAAPDAGSQLTKNRYDALEAVRLIANLHKAAGSTLSDADFAAQMKNLASEMLDIAADSDMKLHDLESAESELKSSLANTPADGWADYNLGVVYLEKSPPQIADGFWFMARAVPVMPNADAALRKYLRNLIMAYQHSNCEVAAESEAGDLIRLAAASPVRPASFTIPSKLSQEQEQQCAPQAPAAPPLEAKNVPQATPRTPAPAAAVETKNVSPAAPPAPVPAAIVQAKSVPPATPRAPAPAATIEAKNVPPASPRQSAPAARADNTPPPQPLRRGLTPDDQPKILPAAKPNGRYFALVIGINDYANAPKLKTAVKDAQAVAAVLQQQYGFETKILTDATRQQIIHALGEYRQTLDENANLLIYYAGHGVYDKDADKTYWLPVDGQMRDTTNWIIADEITTDIKVIPARHILIISDSCYSGGITRSVDMAFTPQEQGRYLEKMTAGKSRTLMASGGLEPVSDEGVGGHSVFAGALLRGLASEEDATFSAESLFEQFIRISVAGQSEQTPQYTVIRNSGHDSGDFVFTRATPNTASN